MIDIQYFPAALLAIRGACHVLIFLRVVTYMSSVGEHHRKTVGLAAAAFAGLNLAEALRVFVNFSAFSQHVEPYLPGVMVFVLIFVTWSGGNVARLFPRKVLERLP